jgi:TRAP-type C4-dicarboxylate transport system permease small subunit
MPLHKIAAIILIAVGTLGLVYGGFNYTKETHEADIGPLSLSIDEKEYVNVPVWAGIAAIIIGAALLVLPRKI